MVRGFKIGQSYEEIEKTFPPADLSGVYDWKGDLGTKRITISGVQQAARLVAYPSETPSEWVKRFEGVERIELLFLDGKLASIEVNYDSTTQWRSLQEFTSAIASTLSLPSKGWRGTFPIALDCTGLRVETRGGLPNPQLIIKTGTLESELMRCKTAVEKQKRHKLKP